MLNNNAGSKRVPGWVRSLILTSLVLLSIFGVWQAFVVPPCGRIVHAAAECPVGSTATFPNTLGIAGGTLFTMTISGVPTASGTYTIPDSAGNDTFGLLGTAGIWTADQIFNDNVNLTFGTGGDATIDYNGSDLVIDPRVVGGGNLLINTKIKVETTSAGADGELNLKIPASGTGQAMIRFTQGAGDGTANNMEYALSYFGNSGYLRLTSDDIDGSQTSGDIWRVLDGTDDLTLVTGHVGIGTSTFPSSGGSGLVFGDGAALSGMASNTAGLYADDVAGTVELFAIDEAGNATQISPHPSDFLNSLAPGCDLPWAFQSANPYVGKQISVDLCGAIQALELLTGQTFITISNLPPEELRDWATDQQANFDKCIADGGTDGAECVKEQPPQWMIDRGVQGPE